MSFEDHTGVLWPSEVSHSAYSHSFGREAISWKPSLWLLLVINVITLRPSTIFAYCLAHKNSGFFPLCMAYTKPEWVVFLELINFF